MGQINPFRPIIAPGRIVDRPQSRRDSGGKQNSDHQNSDSEKPDAPQTVNSANDQSIDGLAHLDMKA